MTQRLVEWLGGFPPQLLVALLGAMPIAEVRGAIPLGAALKLPILESFGWAVLGNLLPILPLLLFLDPVSAWLRRFPLWKRFFDWLFTRTAAKAEVVQRYEALGLAIFVAIPFPLTGAWTGCVAASLFKLPFRLAFPAIAVGVLVAGLIVSLAVLLGIQLL